MPLLKLWKSLRGHRSSQGVPAGASVEPSNEIAKKTGNRVKKTRGGLSIFGGGPHAGLTKLLKKSPPESILEIGVGDGSRAVAIMQALGKLGSQTRYAAIDSFEMGDGVPLKQFHRVLRNAGFRAQLFPQSVDRGLAMVGRTIGCVDAIVISLPAEAWCGPTTQPLLTRVCHPQTTIYCLEDEQWRSRPAPNQGAFRRAA